MTMVDPEWKVTAASSGSVRETADGMAPVAIAVKSGLEVEASYSETSPKDYSTLLRPVCLVLLVVRIPGFHFTRVPCSDIPKTVSQKIVPIVI